MKSQVLIKLSMSAFPGGPGVEIQKIGADLAAFGAPTTTDDDPGFWSD